MGRFLGITVKRFAPCRCLDPTKCLWRLEPDRRSNFFSPPEYLCGVTYITKISLHVPLSNQSHSQLWPTDLIVNGDHLLIRDQLPTKFETSAAKLCRVISCIRLRDTATYRPIYMYWSTCAKQYAPLLKGHSREGLGVKSRMCPPYPQHVIKGD